MDGIQNTDFLREVIPIHHGWEFKSCDDPASTFKPVSRFPTNVHLDLLHHGMISDPFMGDNENYCQWVGETAWVYRTQFFFGLKTREAVLVFDGLDTYATVKLNGTVILKTENMFMTERANVTELLAAEGQNVLEIFFASTYLIGKQILQEHPNHKWGCWNGDPSRLAVRKAQYHYGWDWGPKLLTCGPWRPINLELYTSRISDLYFLTEVHSSLESAEIVVNADVEGRASHVRFDIIFDGEIEGQETAVVVDGVATASFRRDRPKLWWPAGYGEQPLYIINATLLENKDILDVSKKRFGLRRAKVIQRELKDEPGSTFMFEINNIPIFCGGSCWIPAESFIPRMTPQKYWDWVKLAVDGNQIMIRAWAGGVYEEQAFYDACDELGVLVYQDFLFACGNYPAHHQFIDLIKREATANLKALRHHPSIVIWAGNNEDYQYCETENLGYDPLDMNPGNWLKTTFPARYIYEKILKDAAAELVPNAFYHFGSPYGGSSTTDQTIGDIHQWNVWHGTQSPYQEFDRLSGRFVSEFGMEAFPNPSTIDSFLPRGAKDAERYAQSRIMDFHNKAAGHERRLATYLTENMQYTFKPFEQYVYATQLLQAECLGTAYRLFRRQWKGSGNEYCAGALCWQLNDCWPGISWSIIDHHLRPKLGYYAVKRELAPITVSAKRVIKMDKDNKEEVFMEIWASNFTLIDRKCEVDVRLFEISTGKIVGIPFWETRSITLLSNRSTEIGSVPLAASCKMALNPFQIVAAIDLYYSLLETGERKIATTTNWPEPLKHVRFQQPKHLKVRIVSGAVKVSAEVPVKAVWLDVPHEEGRERVVWDDNGFDVMPGEIMEIGVKGLGFGEEDRIRVRYMGSEGECLP